MANHRDPMQFTPISLPKTVLAVDLESATTSTYIETPELPPFQVDYLSHVFSEEDVAASWKVVTKQKNAVVNGIRLENASWRTWWKRKNNLKTINPDTLNWLKDSDVTWLYGPLHSTSWFYQPKESSTSDKLGLMGSAISPPLSPSGLKPVLKRRTISDIFRSSTPVHRRQPWPQKARMPKRTSDSVLKARPTPISAPLPVASNQALHAHHQPRLRFNDQVEQCIAVSDNDAQDEEEEESSDDGALVFHVQKPSPSSIVKLQPTRLKSPENKIPRGRRQGVLSTGLTASHDWASWDIIPSVFNDDEESWRGVDEDEEEYKEGGEEEEDDDGEELDETEEEDYFSFGLRSKYGSTTDDDPNIANFGSTLISTFGSNYSTSKTHNQTRVQLENNNDLDQDDVGIVDQLMTNVKSTVNWWSSLIFSGNVL